MKWEDEAVAAIVILALAYFSLRAALNHAALSFGAVN